MCVKVVVLLVVIEEKRRHTSINDRYNILTSLVDRCAVHSLIRRWYFSLTVFAQSDFFSSFVCCLRLCGVFLFQLTIIFGWFRSRLVIHVKNNDRGNPFHSLLSARARFKTISSDWVIVLHSVWCVTNDKWRQEKKLWWYERKPFCGQPEVKESRQKQTFYLRKISKIQKNTNWCQ